MDDWYVISNVDRIDSPALAFYPDRISGNIELAKRIIGDTNRLRPHVKTNKAAEVSRMLLDAGIRKFKCATIAEAEMLGHMNAPDVLLAYQPVGPKISRLLDLIKAYPATHYSCLVDQAENARAISALCEAGNESYRSPPGESGGAGGCHPAAEVSADYRVAWLRRTYT